MAAAKKVNKNQVEKALVARIKTLEKIVKESSQVMDDWTTHYASEFCEDERVLASAKRVMEAGGTLAYIADQVARNRKVLED